jgi:hypothetical protein
VKILKVLHNVFMVPLEQSKAMTSELVQMVFPPSLLVLKEWHNSFEFMLKTRWKEHNALIKEIGDCLNVVSDDVFVQLQTRWLNFSVSSLTAHRVSC